MSIAEPITPGAAAPRVLDQADVAAFAADFFGQVIQPGDPDYEAARRVWNSMIDKRPALIARCAGTADVATAVQFARAHDLEIAVRGGGHNVAGTAVNDGGLVIDCSLMKGIQVDPTRRVARAQAGVVWAELDRETQRYGLAAPGGAVSTTGIAGFTLAGGISMAARKWGLACDNLLSAEVVTAEGEVLRASVSEHPDLFWGLRGGGGNFGIVTWFEFQLHPIGPEVFNVTTFYALSNAEQMLRGYRDYIASAPDEVTTLVGFRNMPPLPGLAPEWHNTPIVAVVAPYAGDAGAGERVMQPLRELAEPIIDLSGRASYVQVQAAFDPFYPDTLRYYWKSLNFNRLDDEMIARMVALAAERPSSETLIALRHLGGAISEVPEDATAYGNRAANFNLSLDSTWFAPEDDAINIDWTRAAWEELRQRGDEGGVYLNFAGFGEENALLARAGYGGNLTRLEAIKRRYDPRNVFRGNINIAP